MTDIAIEYDAVLGVFDAVYENGDIKIVGKRGGADVAGEKQEILQRLRQRLQTQRGEWSFDTDVGLDYFGLIFGDNVTDEAIVAHITAEVSRGYRIRSVLSLEFERLDDRRARVRGNVDTDLGTMTFDEEIGA